MLADRSDLPVPHHSQSTDRGRTRFQSSQKTTLSSGEWAGGELGFLFLNSRGLLSDDLCNFFILPDTPMSCFVSTNSKVSGIIIFCICIQSAGFSPMAPGANTNKVYIIDLPRVWEDWRETTEGCGAGMWVCRGHLQGLRELLSMLPFLKLGLLSHSPYFPSFLSFPAPSCLTS